MLLLLKGIRSVLIDKDNKPNWNPKKLSDGNNNNNYDNNYDNHHNNKYNYNYNYNIIINIFL